MIPLTITASACLFGRHEPKENQNQTKRLLRLMEMQGFTHLAVFKGAHYWEAPQKYEFRIVVINDNGGELNVEWVNHHEEMVSVASTWHSFPLNAETMHGRIMNALNGEPIDYDAKSEPIEDLNQIYSAWVKTRR